MRRIPLFWQLYPPYLIIIGVSILALCGFASHSARLFYSQRTLADLESRAQLAAGRFNEAIAAGDFKAVDALCKQLGKDSSTRLTVILPGGQVVGDSDDDPATMDNHAFRPEVTEALHGAVGSQRRFSHTLKIDMFYVAAPLRAGAKVVAAVRAAAPAAELDKSLWAMDARIGAFGALAALVAAALSYTVFRRTGRKLEELKRGAERFAQGDLHHPLQAANTEEIGALADAMNRMAAQLDERIRSGLQQRHEQEAVLSSMMEGVLAVDREERVMGANQAVVGIMGVEPAAIQGRPIQEVVRNADLQRFVKRALSSQSPVEGDIVMREDEERYLQAHGTVLRDAQGESIGALVVLNDVTRLRRLENIRREFVANVSHELKTPITSIKGFVETLLDGALENPQDARRFLNIVSKQADRLGAIIEDLLSLSKIEQQAEHDLVHRQTGDLAEVIDAAVHACELQANEKNIAVDWNCDPDLRADLNAPLLEQALVNLIGNAIKYSDPGRKVGVQAMRENGEVRLSVRDEGCGIEAEHLPRLFERFYRVDKARSRKAGGTGLGLAIVKHIAQAHGGRVSVESQPGKGSVFTLHLPG